MFGFDENKPFGANFEAFLSHMESVDVELAAILRANAAKLSVIVKNGERNSQARTEFNTIVAAALDKFVQDSAQKGGV